MKYIGIPEVIVGLFVLACLSGFLYGGYDHHEPPTPAEDIVHALPRIPSADAERYGTTDRSKMMYNIVVLVRAVNVQAVRIQKLEARITELEKSIKPTPDPNEVAG